MKLIKKSLAILMMAQCLVTPIFATTVDRGLTLEAIGNYATGYQSEDGGIAEIIKFNPDNNKFYLINGKTSTIEIVSLESVLDQAKTAEKQEINLEEAIKEVGFQYGDITSIAIQADRDLVAVAVQHKEYNKNGKVVVLDYEGKILKIFEAGVQPDMVTFTPDGKYILAANEGEPRNGYGKDVEDPEGSITIIDLSNGLEKATSEAITFRDYDTQRALLLENQVLLKEGAKPSEDLEPEYITVSSDSKKAYVALQEANAIATIDLATRKVESVKGLGFKDFSDPKNALDMVKDGKIDIVTQNALGVYMPDGIAAYEVDGKTYVVTANEGDAREYTTEEMDHIKEENQYNNVKKIEVAVTDKGKAIKTECLDNKVVEGLDANQNYLFGARSFSIWDAETMTQVFDSGSDFEEIIAKVLPEYFNTTNKEVELDNRSGKKGPEAEDVKVGEIDGRFYAFVGLERIGGIMVYDITNPYNAKYQSYINTRDFTQPIGGDSAPEGIEFVPQNVSPTGKALVLVANEVSGTVSILEVQ
ncbi:choice-of-anchor I family protein [Niameybacter massiliensis]|uniref:choice-of-anchor I family protein n=1 Tax=Niameybacter massiliensis TaxID=1658108 RepID=UPI0006B46ECB|nr:choice-of-anchor I family protein [Niameybacter massiliensis]